MLTQSPLPASALRLHISPPRISPPRISPPLWARKRILALAVAAVLPATAMHARAADILKADNADDLDLVTSWVDGIVPTAEDIAIWNNTVTSANATALSAPVSIGGLRILNPAGAVTIGAVGGTNALTLGRFGIDMSAATQDLVINAPVTIQGLGGIYDWTVASGRSLTLTALPTKIGRGSNNTGLVRFSTTGTITLGGAATNLLIDNQNNPYALYGNNDWAATDGTGKVVAATYTPAVTALTAGANNDVQGDFGHASTIDFTSLRFNDPTPRTITIANSGTSRTWTARGILVTENSGGGTIGGQANTSFIRPSRPSGGVANTHFPIVQNSASDFTISANIANASSGTPTHVVKHGPGTLILTHAGNGYTGGATITGGRLSVANNGHLGSITSAAPVTLAGGTLLTTATMALDNGVNFRGLVVNPAGGALEVAPATTLSVGGVISGSGTLNKNGAGTLVISGAANTHNGVTAVNAGSLQMTPGSNLAGGLSIASGASVTGGGTVAGPTTINGGLLDGTFTTGDIVINTGGRTIGSLGTGAITVNAGATFSGEVTSSGTVTVNSGAIVAPGNSIGTMNLAGLALAAGTQTLNYEFGVAGAQDRINVTGADTLTLSGAAGSKTINIGSDGSGTISNGVYTLIDYAGSALADVSQLALGSLPLRVQAVGGLIHNTGDTSIQVNLASDAPKWVGNVSSNWDINTTQNWREITSGNVTTYLQPGATGDNVLFDSTAVNGTVNLTTTLAPASITIDNTNALAYSFVGGGKITGTSGVTKLGAGTATLANTGGNDYTGPTTVSGGSLVLGADNVIGDASDVTVNGGATLNVGAQNDAVGEVALVDGTISGTTGVLSAAGYDLRKGSVNAILGGAGGLAKTTADLVTLAAPASYAGGTAIESGTLSMGTANALPAGSLVTLGANAESGTLDLNGNALEVAGLATAGSGGAANTVTSAAAATLTLSGAGISSFAGSITGAVALTKNGGGTQFLAGANSYSGGTTIGGGILNIDGDAALGSGNLAFAGTGGTLQVTATIGSYSTARAITLGAGATGTFDSNGAANTLELTGPISGEGILGKVGAGSLRIATANTYSGGTAMGGGNLLVGNNGALGTGTINFSGGSIQLDNGITLSNNFVSLNAAGDNMIDVPGGGDATFAGNVSNTGGGQFRPAATGGGTLYLTGASDYTSFFIIPRGHVAVAGTGSVNTTSNAIVGRMNQFVNPVSLTIRDSASFAAATLAMGGGASGGGTTDLSDYAVTVRDNATLTITGNVDLLNAVATTSGVSRLDLDGGVTTAGGFVKTTTTVGSNVNFNGGTLRAAASNAAFLPALTGLTAEVRDGGATIDSNGFDIAIDAPLVAGGSGTGGLTKAGAGTLTLNAASTYGGPTAATGGRLLLNQSLTTSSAVSASNDGTIELASDGSAMKVIRTGAVSTSGSGRIDLKDNKLITSTPVGAFVAGVYEPTSVSGQIQSGRGSAGGNAQWNGASGITTSDVRAIDTGNRTSLGVIDASDKFRQPGGAPIGEADTALFAGQVVTGADTLVMFTWGGDANLDGKINIDDYGRIDSNVGTPGANGWANGDFNYDGKINIDDYGIIDSNISNQGGVVFPTSSDAFAGATASAAMDGVSAVPEPASLSLLAVGATALMRRRRRSNQRGVARASGDPRSARDATAGE